MIADTTIERNNASLHIRAIGKRWFWLDNALYDDYAPLIGPDAVLLYMALARHANNKTAKCWPSLAKIATHLGIDVARMEVALDRLVAVELVWLETQPGKGTVITLLAVSTPPTAPVLAPEMPPVVISSHAREDEQNSQQDINKKKFCSLSEEEREEQECCSPVDARDYAALTTTLVPCDEISLTLTASPYEISEKHRLAQCSMNQEEIAGLFATVWPAETAARQIQPAPMCVLPTPHELEYPSSPRAGAKL